MQGFYAICAIFEVSSQSAFEKYINPQLLKRETTLKNDQYYAAKRELKKEMKKARENADGTAVPAQKKSEPARYVNPKKKKKKTEGSPSPSTEETSKEEKPKKGGYTEAELAKMEEDRIKVRELSDKDFGDIKDVSVYEDDGE